MKSNEFFGGTDVCSVKLLHEQTCADLMEFVNAESLERKVKVVQNFPDEVNQQNV